MRPAGGLRLAGIIVLLRRPVVGERDVARRSLYIVAAAFLLSPTQFPWYYLWCLPLLALCPRPSLLLLTVLLPLYYLRFYVRHHYGAGWFDYGIVWVEYVPVWCLLVWEAYMMRTAAGSRDAE